MRNHREAIEAIVAQAFPENFSQCRFPYTYHDDYGRLHDPKYQELSDRDVSELFDEIESYYEAEYELHLYAVMYLVTEYPSEFLQAVATDDSFWHLLESLKTQQKFNERWMK